MNMNTYCALFWLHDSEIGYYSICERQPHCLSLLHNINGAVAPLGHDKIYLNITSI